MADRLRADDEFSHWLQQALLLTLAYSAVFDFPLTTSEWLRRLVVGRRNIRYLISFRQLLQKEPSKILQLLLDLRVKRLVEYDTEQKVWFLAAAARGGDKTNLPDRAQLARVAAAKRQEALKVAKMCTKLPWIEGLAITGSVAVENARPNDDVDFMVVAAPRRLWLVRPLLLMYAQWHGKRRTWRGEEQNSWCFNLWLEPDSLRLPLAQRSLYTAYEVNQTDWLLSKNQAQKLFFLENSWASDVTPLFFANSIRRPTRLMNRETNFNRLTDLNPLVYLLDVANLIAYFIQHAYMRRHMTRERVQHNFAAFHPRDTKNKIHQQIHQKLGLLRPL